jgi:hypothetical protein
LKRYLCEFDFRYSNREAGIDDVQRAISRWKASAASG